MDLGIKAIWYDLPDAGRDDYLDWLHGTYLPKLLQRPRYLWAAHFQVDQGDNRVTFHENMNRVDDEEVGQGTQFVLVMGAENPHVFFTADEDNRPEDADPTAQEMVGRRIGSRLCVFSEVDRVKGPEAAARPDGTTLGPAIQFGSFRTRTVEQEFDVSKWYAQYRLPAVAEMPGCIAARRLACIAGWPHHAVIYEFASMEARLNNFQKHESLGEVKGEWTNRVALDYTFHSPGSPSVAERIWPAVK